MRLTANPSGHRYNIDITGAGPPLLLLHGFTGDSNTWRDFALDMSDDFKVIRLDVLGHGKSDKPAQASSYQMPAVAADIIDLLNQLEITRARLLGYSLGGRLALYLALTFPERFASLALESASPSLADACERAERRRNDEALASKIEARGIDWFVDYWESLPLWASQANLPSTVLAAQRKQRLASDPRGLANSLRGMGAGAQPSLWGDLPNLRIPTLLLIGALDHKFRRINELMTKTIPDARLVPIPSAGHNSHLENPTAFAQAVRSFLQGV
ncbi:MAG: 2-succinyl-6-hydroxy-2,4-cyclohexadiene-1-carboxylate synthase [Chloroflexi bacterium]|nr:2-succinyl-6-hydroxy-2,4-cyclohexadiene-1-carboxylate synthase [Chloroflexota bacterium]